MFSQAPIDIGWTLTTPTASFNLRDCEKKESDALTGYKIASQQVEAWLSIFLPPLSVIALIFFSISLLSCSPIRSPYQNQVYGIEEFVNDSSSIYQEPKAEIQRLHGKEFCALSEENFHPSQICISEGDILQISIYFPFRKDLMDSVQQINHQMGGFRVMNGMVTLPDIDSTYVEGMTLAEARVELKEKFRQKFKNIDLFLLFKEKKNNLVELTGSVVRAFIPVNGSTRLYEIMAKAHLFADANLYASYVLRKGDYLPVNLHKLVNEGDMNQNIVMQSGDKIFIASRKDQMAIVLGEIREQRLIPMPSGVISIREALAMAHGIPFTGSHNCIQVIRGGIQQPKIFSLSWNCMMEKPNHDLLLIPGDIVYVSQTPITKWHEFFAQLDPSIALLFPFFKFSYGIYAL